jgi:hypothetical protein
MRRGHFWAFSVCLITVVSPSRLQIHHISMKKSNVNIYLQISPIITASFNIAADYWELRPVAGSGEGADGDVVHAGRPPHHVSRPQDHQARVQGDPPQQGGHQDRPGPARRPGGHFPCSKTVQLALSIMLRV